MSAPTSAVGGGDKQSRNLIPPKNPSIRCGGGGREKTNLQVVFLGGPWERCRAWEDVEGHIWEAADMSVTRGMGGGL